MGQTGYQNKRTLISSCKTVNDKKTAQALPLYFLLWVNPAKPFKASENPVKPSKPQTTPTSHLVLGVPVFRSERPVVASSELYRAWGGEGIKGFGGFLRVHKASTRAVALTTGLPGF